DWACLEVVASLARFGNANAIPRLSRRHAVVQVKQNDVVPQLRETGNGPAAAVLGITGMTAGDDDLHLWGCIVGLRSPGCGGATQREGLAQQLSAVDRRHEVGPGIGREPPEAAAFRCVPYVLPSVEHQRSAVLSPSGRGTIPFGAVQPRVTEAY